MSGNDAQIVAELRALRDEVRTLSDLIAGPRSGRQFVSGAQAARLLGVSWPTFKARYIQTGMVRPQCGRKYELKAVKNLTKS